MRKVEFASGEVIDSTGGVLSTRRLVPAFVVRDEFPAESAAAPVARDKVTVPSPVQPEIVTMIGSAADPWPVSVFEQDALPVATSIKVEPRTEPIGLLSEKVTE